MSNKRDEGLKVPPDKWHYSWDEFDMHTHRLVEVIRQSELAPHCILALGRGASPLAAALSNVFDARMFFWGLSSYSPMNQQEHMTIYQSLPDQMEKELHRAGENLLLVDDIWDTGKTFQWGASRYPAAKRVCLVHKPGKNQTDIIPHFAAATTANHVWVEFPWEKNYG